MTTADQVLEIEAQYLGTNGDKVRAWYPLPQSAPFCCAGQSMSLTEAGIPTHFAYVTYLLDAYETEGHYVSDDARNALPGDLVCFDWGGGRRALDHIAMIIRLTETGAWTRNANVNGGKWADLWFPFDGGGMAYIARPKYTTPTPPQPTNESEEMKRYLMRGADAPEVYLVDAGLGWKWHIPAGQISNVVWSISQAGGEFVIPAGAKVDVVEKANVWVVEQSFVNVIPKLA